MTTKTVYARMAESAALWPNRPVLEVMNETAKAYGIAAGSISYADFQKNADDWADRFEAKGYGAGVRVAVLLENRPDFFVLFCALNRIGASIIPINPDLRLSELTYLIGHGEPALVIALSNRLDELKLAVAETSLDVPVITLTDNLPAVRTNAVVTKDLSGDAREAAVLYTSGTTGKPKGCVLPNAYFLLAGRWYADLDGLANLSMEGERMITPLPVFHMNAMAYSYMAMLSVGGCLIVLDRFHPRSWWENVTASSATCLHYLGVMPSVLMKLPSRVTDRTHNVRFGFGAGINPKIHAGFEDRFGIPLVEAWAMTETGAGAVIAANDLNRLVGQSSLGRAKGWVATRVVDDSGKDTGDGMPGELLVRNNGENPRYGFFSHYYKNSTATADAWKDGWFHTGDIVTRDADGRFKFVDREKNVIRRSGENIAAVEVESVLMHHESVRAAGVTPVPDALRGDEVFACLVVDNPSSKLAHDIATWALGQMAYYKVPGYIAFVDTLPLTSTQKIQRKVLKEKAATLILDPKTICLTSLKKRQVA